MSALCPHLIHQPVLSSGALEELMPFEADRQAFLIAHSAAMLYTVDGESRALPDSVRVMGSDGVPLDVEVFYPDLVRGYVLEMGRQAAKVRFAEDQRDNDLADAGGGQ